MNGKRSTSLVDCEFLTKFTDAEFQADLRKSFDSDCQAGGQFVLAFRCDRRGAVADRGDPAGLVDLNHVGR